MLGRRTALALCRAGGLIYVPIKLNPRTRLVRMIGLQSTAKLQRRWAGMHLNLPKLAAMDRAKRDAEIHKLNEQGVSRHEIARQHGLTMRQIFNIIRRCKNQIHSSKTFGHSL